jgi:hypothetical protein
MGLRGITLNTPPEEEAHIIAEDDAAIYQSIFGEDGVFTIGDRMKATVINNNQVRVSNGVICVGGHIARTVYGDYSDMTIENGEISKNRNDIITAVFSTTGEKGIDKFKIEVKKGTPGVVAEDPELTKENLYEGGKLRELPLWRVKLEGINIIGVEQMFKIIHKIPDLEEMIESLNGNKIDGNIPQPGVIILGQYAIQWGSGSTKSTNATANIKLRIPYESSNYFVTHTWTHNANLVSKSWLGDDGANDVRTTEEFKIYMQRTNSNYPSHYLWMTIGKLPE